jgi:hypothetical protein
MARGSKNKYTSKQKRKAHDIERGYKNRGVSSKEGERRAWATVNKSDKGGRKKGGGGRGKKRSKSSSRKAEEKAAESRTAQRIRRSNDLRTNRDQMIRESSANFILIWFVSFAQPWLPVCQEQCAFSWADRQSFSSVAQLALPS